MAIAGSITFRVKSSDIDSMVIEDMATGFQGVCRFDQTDYRCLLPYEGDSANLTLTVTASDYVCGAVDGVFTYLGYYVDGSPYTQDIQVEKTPSKCP